MLVFWMHFGLYVLLMRNLNLCRQQFPWHGQNCDVNDEEIEETSLWGSDLAQSSRGWGHWSAGFLALLQRRCTLYIYIHIIWWNVCRGFDLFVLSACENDPWLFAWAFESEFQETCKELSTLGGKVHGLAADVSSKEGREAARNQTSTLTNQQKLIIDHLSRNKLNLHFCHSQFFIGFGALEGFSPQIPRSPVKEKRQTP